MLARRGSTQLATESGDAGLEPFTPTGKTSGDSNSEEG
jgi:hypothetical protein